jgi:hypothetical protein
MILKPRSRQLREDVGKICAPLPTGFSNSKFQKSCERRIKSLRRDEGWPQTLGGLSKKDALRHVREPKGVVVMSVEIGEAQTRAYEILNDYVRLKSASKDLADRMLVWNELRATDKVRLHPRS